MKDRQDGSKKKAPDGGIGWLVCLGSSLIALTLRSLDPSFGLLFHDILRDLHIESTGTSVIMSFFDGIFNFSGLFVGPLLKKFSYRKVAFLGAILSCTGFMLTSTANSMAHIICTYSLLGGLGTGFAIASSFVALNTFFDKKRGQAVGFSMAGTSLAMILMPQMIYYLLLSYGFRGTMLIFGAWALHSAVGATLLFPLETETVEKKRDALLDGKTEMANGKTEETMEEKDAEQSLIPKNHCVKEGIEKFELEDRKTESWLEKFKNTFDLDLLKNGTYLNVIFGTGLYYVAESNIKLMTPFFLSSIGMTNGEIAFCLTLAAFTDIFARLILPTIFDRLGYKKRSIFWVCTGLVTIARFVLAEQKNGLSVLVVIGIAGFLRGATVVNLNLCVSECCSLKKLPSAFGMYMVTKGVCVVAISPLIGFVRDYTGSYRICIHAMAVMVLVTFVAWGIEYSCDILRRRRDILAEKARNETVE